MSVDITIELLEISSYELDQILIHKSAATSSFVSQTEQERTAPKSEASCSVDGIG